jgi:hypothetical protein
MVRVHGIDASTQDAQNVNDIAQNVNDIAQNVIVSAQNVKVDIEETHKPFSCDNCKRSFKRNYHLQRHIQVCDGMIDSSTCKYCNKVLSCRASKSQHQKICKARHLLDVSVVPPNLPGTVGLLNQGTVNNIQGPVNMGTVNNNNTNTNSNNTLNITINNFGKEKMEHISPEFIEKCIRMGSHSSVYEIFKKISLDPEVPENHNVRVYSERKQQMCVYKDNRWTLQDKNATLNEIVQVFNDLMVNSYNENEKLREEDICEHQMKLRCILRDISTKYPTKEHANLCRQLFTSILDLGALQGYRLQMSLVPMKEDS